MAAAVAAFGLLAALSAQADGIDFAPEYTGSFDVGGGATASFYQIDSNWHGSTVLYDPNTGTYGSGVPIGTLPWGTGLWGQADWQTIQQTAAGLGGTGAPPIINAWTGTVSAISYANAIYNTDYSTTWGPAQLVPFFSANGAQDTQENWTAHFSGFIRVTDAGAYNFSVLNDDGFFLTLVGANGATLQIGRDYLNPRERDGFADLLNLTPGLYGFDLGMWNRLEAGVVDLRWQVPGSEDWTLVPTTNLVAVPEPAAAWLLGAGLLALAIRRRRKAAAHAA